MTSLLKLHQPSSIDYNDRAVTRSAEVKGILKEKFHSTWTNAANSSSKLRFYSTVKKDISFERYLTIVNRKVRTSVARLRSSSHRLNVETARYQRPASKHSTHRKKGVPENKEWNRCCKVCCNDNVELLQQMPFAESPITEDEHHVLVTCPTFHHLRLQLNDHIKSSLLAWDERLSSLFEEPSVHEFSLYIHKIFQLRFPKMNNGGSKLKNATQKKE